MNDARKFRSVQHQVWALAHLDDESEEKLKRFFASRAEVVSRRIRRGMHVTIYQARRPMPGLVAFERRVEFVVPGEELRLMAMAPGGENPREDIDPTQASIGLRIRKGLGRAPLEQLRAEFYPFETGAVLGRRAPSTAHTNAFGARWYQPHITVLRAGGVTQRDLRPIGEALRSQIDLLRFDRLRVELRTRTLPEI